MSETLVAAWDRLIATIPGSQRPVELKSSLNAYYGSDEVGRPLVIVTSNQRPLITDLSSVVDVQVGKRTIDDRWALSLTLLDASLSKVFLALLSDLLHSVKNVIDEGAALATFVVRLDNWRQIFAENKSSRLGIDGMRGLFGELWWGFMSGELDPNPATVVSSWVGPVGAPHDFLGPDLRMYEVKSTHPGSRFITISSAEQLWSDDNDLSLVLISLAHQEVDQYSPEDHQNWTTLSRLVAQIESSLSDDVVYSAAFRSRLSALSVDISDPYYERVVFRVQASRSFHVCEDFPRIGRDAIPLGIERVSYRLDLNAIRDYEH